MSSKEVFHRSERIALRRLLWVGPLAIAASVAGTIMVRLLAGGLFKGADTFLPLTWITVIFYTFVLVLGAVIVFALMGRFARRPIQLFRRVALVVLLLTFIPDGLLVTSLPLFPGVTLQAVFPGATPEMLGTLVAMHVLAAAVSVGILTTLGQA